MEDDKLTWFEKDKQKICITQMMTIENGEEKEVVEEEGKGEENEEVK